MPPVRLAGELLLVSKRPVVHNHLVEQCPHCGHSVNLLWYLSRGRVEWARDEFWRRHWCEKRRQAPPSAE